MKARETLLAIISDCEMAKRLPDDPVLLRYHLEIAVHEGKALLELSNYNLTEGESKSRMADARVKLEKILKDAVEKEVTNVAALAAMALLQAKLNDGFDVRSRAFRVANEYGFGNPDDQLVFAEFATVEAIAQAPGCIPTIDQAIEWMTKLAREYPLSIAPRFHSRVELILGKCYVARSQITRYGQPGKSSDDKLGSSYLDEENAYRVFRVLADKFSEDSFPLIRAEALFRAATTTSSRNGIRGPMMEQAERIKVFERLLNDFTKETHPIRWAIINVRLSECYSVEKLKRTDDAKLALENALTIFTKDAFPHTFAYCTEELKKIVAPDASSDK